MRLRKKASEQNHVERGRIWIPKKNVDHRMHSAQNLLLGDERHEESTRQYLQKCNCENTETMKKKPTPQLLQ